MREANLRVETAAAGPLWAKTHVPLLGQLLENLLDNACKYSESGTPARLRQGEDATTVLLAVEDEGVGVPAEDLPHVFEPFFRSAEARKRGINGVGLGLAVARRIAVVFGGSLTASSTVGKGTTMTLRLPALNPLSPSVE